jgi:peptide/nickel transport system substrate-binding protein
VIKKEKIMKRLLIVLIVLMMVPSLVSCAPAPTEQSVPEVEVTPEATTEVMEPVKGGVLNIMGGAETTLLFHQIRATQGIANQWLFQETLMKYDDQGVPQPYLLESISGDNDTKIWTLKVRQGVKFSDGSDLNAEVVAWNINIYKEKGIFKDSFYANVSEAVAVDEYTVEVHMTNWDSLFPYTLARTMPIASKQSYDEFGEAYFEEHPIGTGPFILEKWERDVSMDLVANPNYWRGAPLVDGIKFTVYNEALVAQAAMVAGELDMMATNDYALAKQMESEGFTLYVAAVPTSAYTLAFRSNDPDDPFYDVNVRRAVSHAINVDEIIDTLFFGYGIKSTQWGTPDSEFYNPDVTGNPYDVEKAKELLTEAGYPDGFKTKLTTFSGATYSDISQIIIEQLAQIGIEVEFRPIEGSAVVQYIGDWEEGMFLHPMGMENGAASQLAATFQKDLTFALGIGSFEHPDDLDQMVKNALNAEPDQVAGLFQEIQKVVFDERVYMKTIAIGPYIGIVSPRVHDSNYSATQWLSCDCYLAWKDAE